MSDLSDSIQEIPGNKEEEKLSYVNQRNQNQDSNNSEIKSITLGSKSFGLKD